MARGGKRQGAGRKKGAVTKATVYRQEMLAKAAAEGVSPLDFMLSVLRDDTKPFEDRFKAAVQAAPYVHPRLASIDHTGDLTVRTQDEAMSELEQAADAAEHAATVAHVTH